MAQKKDTALRLMLVADLVNEAEAVVSRLRNAGIAVRPLRPESMDDLADMLAGQPVDMLLADYAAVVLPFEQVAKAVMGCGKDVPLLAMLDGITDDILENVQALGAQAVALRDRPQQFLKNVQTEWNDLEARRSQRRLEAQMRETQRRCDMLIDSSREPIAYIHEGMHIRANQAYLEMFGYESFDDIEGMSLLDLVAPGDVDAFKTLLKSLSKGEEAPPRYELTARDSEGNSFPAVMEFSPAEYQGEHCQQVIFRHQAVEVDPELARELEELRKRDQATGLLNRPTFLHTLEEAVVDAAQSRQQYGLLLLEPDNYQRYLNEIGLDSADDLLAAIAHGLQSTIDTQQLAENSVHVARFGEHSFAVLIRGDHTVTTTLAERIRIAASEQVFEVGGKSGTITASIGGVQIGEKNASVTQAMAKASQCLQSSLGVGGNHIEIFDPSAVDRAEEERIQAWVERLRDALINDRFLLHYQPIIHLMGEPRPIYEGYLRLDFGTGETVSPSSFMHIAEEHGLLGEIDRWVIRHAIDAIAERKQAGKDVTVLLKITQSSLQDDTLPGFIGERLAEHGLSGSALLLQVPESKVFINLRAVQDFATAIGQYGCQMVLEQFGAGLDSFQLLTHFQPSFIKIDRSFTEDLAKNSSNQQRIRELAQKAHDMGIQSIAEFVQDAASMTILFASGISYAEGDFLAVAAPTMNYDFDL
ncbi:MAG: bifunctional diguanylate cyclase/phosphodiesterase [Thermomonas sp.]|uniref:bifunctional diguanylate cyclase/phosphodiesterase n=1 Tax=Thermomonas sp. TaxID=1971895 RepID=UPI001EB94DA0|nr:bifunctional diguanylate cyclase/phosphodiesterase [Thermomonas sp.]MBV2208101.1 bifunctional diguanylate cyclase/phosphodiesterase [Thermomonas sp.]